MNDPVALYVSLINSFVDLFGTSHSMMHIHVGLGIYLAMQVITRERRGSMLALNVVFAAEMMNETFDRLAYGSWRWGDTASDILLTMMWPVAITVVSQYRRRRWIQELSTLTPQPILAVARHEDQPAA